MRKGLAVLVSILAAHTLAAAQVEDGTLIVPGKRIGPYNLGMTLAGVIGLMGSVGERGSTTMPQSYGMLWRDKRIYFSFFNATHTVSAATLLDSEANRVFRTADGVGLGSPGSELDRFGRPEWRHQYPGNVEARAYWRIGLYVQTKEGRIIAIGVFDHKSQ
ncbi:MAG: hypothetical protein QN168_03975 [Armatimonadota bacterium]|nr:hypothetical protein [Armatimonadota bacterium]